jgi:hypothetical protein
MRIPPMETVAKTIFHDLAPIVVVAVYFRSFYHFERLLEVEYRLYRPLWIADGRPMLMFGVMKDALAEASARRDGSGFLRSVRLFFTWIFCAPDWVTNSLEVRRILWLARWWLLLTCVAMILMFELV